MNAAGPFPRRESPATVGARMNEWKPVCRLDDIPVLGARRVARGDATPVAVFRNADDKVFALLDRCPHKGGPLSQGIVFGESVACPLHNWKISLRSGQALGDVVRIVTFIRRTASRRGHALVAGDQEVVGAGPGLLDEGGHRIRLDIQPRDGIGSAPYLHYPAAYNVGGMNTIHTGGDRASYLMLPIIPA